MEYSSYKSSTFSLPVFFFFMKYCLLSSLLVAGLLTTASTAHAQITVGIGPRVGYNLATADYQVTFEDYSYKTGYRSSFEAGIQAAVGFGHFSVQPAVLFSQKGYKLTEQYTNPGYSFSDEALNRTHYVTIPLNFAYAQHPDGQGAQFFVGPYIGFLLGGNYSYSGTSIDAKGTAGSLKGEGDIKAGDYYSTNPTDTNTYQRHVDAGLQAGVGYQLANVLLQAGYSWGLRNISPTNATPVAASSERVLRNRAFQVSLAYLFGFKK